MYQTVAFIESPIQIAIVLIIALLVFGPKKLPEIGKQIGGALRELKKAGNEVMSSFNTDHEPDHHNNNYAGYDYNQSQNSVPYSSPYALNSPPDLSDYTIAGQPPRDSYGFGYDSGHNGANGAQPDEAALSAYDIAPSVRSNGHESGASVSSDHAQQDHAAIAPSEPRKEGSQHV